MSDITIKGFGVGDKIIIDENRKLLNDNPEYRKKYLEKITGTWYLSLNKEYEVLKIGATRFIYDGVYIKNDLGTMTVLADQYFVKAKPKLVKFNGCD